MDRVSVVEAELCRGLDPPSRWTVRCSRSPAGMGVEGKSLVSGLKVCGWGAVSGSCVGEGGEKDAMGQLPVML